MGKTFLFEEEYLNRLLSEVEEAPVMALSNEH